MAQKAGLDYDLDHFSLSKQESFMTAGKIIWGHLYGSNYSSPASIIQVLFIYLSVHLFIYGKSIKKLLESNQT